MTLGSNSSGTRPRGGSAARSSGPAALSRLCEQGLARFRRRVLPHDAAQRGLLVQPAWRLRRAGREHGAPARRQISFAPALDGNGRRPARLFPVGGDPARGFGRHRLSLGLPRPGETMADRRPPDPEAGDAAPPPILLFKTPTHPPPPRP